MLLTVLILFITRSAPDQRDGGQLLLIPKDNGPWIDCIREGTNLKISCNDMAGAAIGLDVLLTEGHCGPTVKKLIVFLKGSYTKKDSSNASCITEANKKDLQGCFQSFIQIGLKSVELKVKSISQVAGIFPSNMDTVNLRIKFLENPVKSELNDWISSFSSVSVKRLTLDALHLDCTVDLEDLFCVLCQNTTLLQIKTKLKIQYGRVSAERALELMQMHLPYKVEVEFMEVYGIQMLSTLKGLLTSKCLCCCTLKVEPGFPDSLTEDKCREILEMEEVSDCLSASPSVCDVLKSLLSRVTVCSKPLYLPVCRKLGDVDYVTDNVFPYLEKKSRLFAIVYKIRIRAKVHAKMVETIKTRHVQCEKESVRGKMYDMTLIFKPPSDGAWGSGHTGHEGESR